MIQKSVDEVSITIGRTTPAGLGPVLVQQGENVLMQDRINILSEDSRKNSLRS